MPVTLSELNKQFNRTRISMQDFEDAESYLQAYNSDQATVANRALLLAAIVWYAIPFTNNERGPSVSATSQLSIRLPKVLTPKERALHERLISLRNEALAHSAYCRSPIVRVYGLQNGFLVQGRPFDILSERIDLDAFKALCAKMRNYCIGRLYTLNNKLGAVE